MATLILKRATASRSSGQWSDDDFDVLADDAVVGRILRSAAVPPDRQWMWTLAYGHHEDRTPTHGYEPTRDRWRRERLSEHRLASRAERARDEQPRLVARPCAHVAARAGADCVVRHLG